MTDSQKIDEYIASLPHWKQEVCRKVRTLIRQADPAIKEEIKFTNRPYFTHKGNVCALLAAKDHVNIFIYDPIASDPHMIINQGQKNQTARAVQVQEGTFPNEEAFIELIREVVSHNEQGGWRRLKKHQSISKLSN